MVRNPSNVNNLRQTPHAGSVVESLVEVVVNLSASQMKILSECAGNGDSNSPPSRMYSFVCFGSGFNCEFDLSFLDFPILFRVRGLLFDGLIVWWFVHMKVWLVKVFTFLGFFVHRLLACHYTSFDWWKMLCSMYWISLSSRWFAQTPHYFLSTTSIYWPFFQASIITIISESLQQAFVFQKHKNWYLISEVLLSCFVALHVFDPHMLGDAHKRRSKLKCCLLPSFLKSGKLL